MTAAERHVLGFARAMGPTGFRLSEDIRPELREAIDALEKRGLLKALDLGGRRTAITEEGSANA